MLGKEWSKGESLEYIKMKGYNTPDFRIVKEKNELLKVLEEFDAWDRKNKVSIRTYRNTNSFNEPFYPNKEIDKGLIIKLGMHLDDGYTLIVARGVDPEGTLFKGNLMIYPSFSMRRFDFTIECTPGYGTVRDLETSKEILKFDNLQDAMNKMGYQIQKIFLAAKDMYQDLNCIPLIIEWSIYEHPVGLKKKDIIYWEVRKGTCINGSV